MKIHRTVIRPAAAQFMANMFVKVPSYKFNSCKSVKLAEALAECEKSSTFSASYTEKIITTGSGKRRVCWRPSENLKKVQRIINACLRKDLPRGTSSLSVAHVKNIIRSKEYDAVLSMDIADFFPSIKWPMLHAELDSILREVHGNSACDRYAHTIEGVSSLVMCDDFLPQGAPTSPIMADLFMRGTDQYLRNYLNKYLPGSTYIRYVDNFYILLPRDLNFRQIGCLKGTIYKHLEAKGLYINHGKTALLRKGGPMEVLGMTTWKVDEVKHKYVGVDADNRAVEKVAVTTHNSMRISNRHVEEVFRYVCNLYNAAKNGDNIPTKEWQSAMGKVQYIVSVNSRLKFCFKKLSAQIKTIDAPGAQTLADVMGRKENYAYSTRVGRSNQLT